MADKAKETVVVARNCIEAVEFKERHRSHAKYFTRNRKLNFCTMIGLMLKKGAKSLQLMLNEWALAEDVAGISNSAYIQARAHLLHTAFVELNEKAVVEVMYRDNDHKLFKGRRLLAVDGSKVILPNYPDTIKEFGQITYKNAKVEGRHTMGLVSVLYDVLNKIAIHSTLGEARSYEVDLAIDHLGHTKLNDVIVADRGFASYLFLATLQHQERGFVIRCSAGSFGIAQRMLKGEGAANQVVTIAVPHSQKKDVMAAGLPMTMQVRFVRILLKTGEYEVLITSLLDESDFSLEDLAEIYRLRWGIESFYGLIKTRLGLENFTGKSAESVRQDFYSTIYLTGLETILTIKTNDELAEKTVRHPQKVNKAVSFNVIKNQALDLLFDPRDPDEVLEKLRTLFQMNVVCDRRERIVPRVKKSSNHLLNHHKRTKKICY